MHGLALGIGARLAMRFVALESGVEAGFSPGGSFEVAAMGVIVGMPVTLLFLLLRPRRRRRAPWRGALVGVLLFVVLWLLPLPAARAALDATPDTPLATAAVFALLFAVWGTVLEYLPPRAAPIER